MDESWSVESIIGASTLNRFITFHLCLLLYVIIALPVSKCALPTGFLVTISYSSALSTLLVQGRFLLLFGFSLIFLVPAC